MLKPRVDRKQKKSAFDDIALRDIQYQCLCQLLVFIGSFAAGTTVTSRF